MFYFDNILGYKVLKSDKLKIPHFFTTREFVLKTKDNIEIAEKNKADLKKFFKAERLISPKQAHTKNVCCVMPDNDNYEDCDGLIIKESKVGIFLNFADCTPIILYDKRQNIGGIIHAGWRGTAQKIAVEALNKMNSTPNDIFALIGPCICYNCFETSKDIVQKLDNTIKNKANCIKNENGKFYADLQEINKRQLEEFGVTEIDCAPFCTVCNNDLFFSYRKENKTTNRISAFLMLD